MVGRLLRAGLRWLLVGCWLTAVGLLPGLIARARQEVPTFDRPVIVQTRGVTHERAVSTPDLVPRARPASLEVAPPVRVTRLEPASSDDDGDDGDSGDEIDPGVPIRTQSPPRDPPSGVVSTGRIELVLEVEREPTTTISPSSTTPNQTTTTPTVAGTSITAPGGGDGDDGELSYTGVGPLTWVLALVAVTLVAVGGALQLLTSGPRRGAGSMLHGAWDSEHTTRQDPHDKRQRARRGVRPWGPGRRHHDHAGDEEEQA
ncbi:MAG: hypothetical protein D6683_05360 [Actinomyces sp.]|nr:MAG: hypothetical protein D6683_05360 [Actinomyces sp.]